MLSDANQDAYDIIRVQLKQTLAEGSWPTH